MPSAMPRITLITVAWNAAATIGDTMDSVAAQAHDDHEHLVIDGASTDATVEIARTRATPRTRILSAPDKGLYDAMNKGLALAQGDYCLLYTSPSPRDH
jgi:glycosyltransferase involved in cell wall biosynthesis